MASRLIRSEILESRRFNELSVHAQNFFFRLMMVADDYGRFYADETVLRNKTFPRTDGIRAADIGRWVSETENTQPPMVRRYSCAEEQFLEIANFGQRTRSKSKFPDSPPLSAGCRQSADKCPQVVGNPLTNDGLVGVGVGVEVEVEVGGDNPARGENSAPPVNGKYPETVEEVIGIAVDAGVIMSAEEAEKYLTFRSASDWVDASRRTITPAKVKADIKKWILYGSGNKPRQGASPQTRGGRNYITPDADAFNESWNNDGNNT